MKTNISELEVLLLIQEGFFNNITDRELLCKKSNQKDHNLDANKIITEKIKKVQFTNSEIMFGFSY
jgi:hypothetical protein